METRKLNIASLGGLPNIIPRIGSTDDDRDDDVLPEFEELIDE